MDCQVTVMHHYTTAHHGRWLTIKRDVPSDAIFNGGVTVGVEALDILMLCTTPLRVSFLELLNDRL